MTRSQTETRIFTMEEVRKMLPLVRVIVRDVVKDFAALRDRVEGLRCREEKYRSAVGPVEDIEILRIREEVQGLRERLESAAEELLELGVELKDFDKGLVDFPARIEGKPAYLCWQHGEGEVAYWHAPDAGFDGRRPIPPEEMT